jgi:hypothetical protein
VRDKVHKATYELMRDPQWKKKEFNICGASKSYITTRAAELNHFVTIQCNLIFFVRHFD